jgi:hypothetical protein
MALTKKCQGVSIHAALTCVALRKPVLIAPMLPVRISHSEACVTVKSVNLVHFTGMHKTGCAGRQDLSCTNLAHHELESVVIIVIIIVEANADQHSVRTEFPLP